MKSMRSKTTKAVARFTIKNGARWLGLLLLVAPVIVLVLRAIATHGQEVVGKNFKAAEYYKPPHDAQMKSLVQGARGERQPDGHSLLVNELKLHTFREDNDRHILSESPQF